MFAWGILVGVVGTLVLEVIVLIVYKDQAMNLEEYSEEVKRHIHDVSWLAKECIERMRINVGLLAENEELKRKLKSAYEDGSHDVLADFHEDNPDAIKLGYYLIGKALGVVSEEKSGWRNPAIWKDNQ